MYSILQKGSCPSEVVCAGVSGVEIDLNGLTFCTRHVLVSSALEDQVFKHSRSNLNILAHRSDGLGHVCHASTGCFDFQSYSLMLDKARARATKWIWKVAERRPQSEFGQDRTGASVSDPHMWKMTPVWIWTGQGSMCYPQVDLCRAGADGPEWVLKAAV